MLQVVFAWGVYCFVGVIDLLFDCFVGRVVCVGFTLVYELGGLVFSVLVW